MRKLDFLLEWYHKENERQSSLNDSINIPIGILTGLSALIFFLLNEYTFDKNILDGITIAFLCLTIVAIILWIVVVYNLYYSYNKLFEGFTYKALPYPSILDNHHKNLQVFVESNMSGLGNTTAEELYENQLKDMIVEYLDSNIKNNDIKSAYLHISKKYIFLCIVFIILSFIPFGLNYLKAKKPNKTVDVFIKNVDNFKKK